MVRLLARPTVHPRARSLVRVRSTGSEQRAPGQAAAKTASTSITGVLLALLATLPLLPLSLAQEVAGPSAELREALTAAGEHPAVQAARAGLAAAEARLRAAKSPVHFDVSSSLTQLDVDDIDLAPEVPGLQALDRTLFSVSTGLRLRPFAFGDIADLVDQREVAVAQAQLDLRTALTTIQVRTLEAAYEVQLARGALEVGQEGAALAREGLVATGLRATRGAATERDRRDAVSAVTEAENLVLGAQENLALAEQALRQLLRTEVLPSLDPEDFAVPLPQGEPAEVLRSGLQVRLAELAPRGAQRALLPTAQASYSFNLGDHDTLSLSLESRTLQPSVTFSHEAQGRAFPQTEIRGALTVGVAWSLSPEAFDSLVAAEAQLEAAQLGLEASRQAAELQTRALTNAAAQAERASALAQTRYADARARLEETRARVEAGLSTPLELQSDALAVTRTQVESHSASLAVLRARLDFYEFYALPLAPLTFTAAPEAREP